MPAKAVQVSIDLDLLRRIDADPETREKGRSAFIRSAVSSYLRARKRREVDTAIARATRAPPAPCWTRSRICWTLKRGSATEPRRDPQRKTIK
jgi:hypothetical protein